MTGGMDAAAQRTALAGLAREQGVSLAELSRVIGRNPAYLQQYLTRGSPHVLAEGDRALLARYLGVAEARLGGRAPSRGVEIARLDIGASAGPGRLGEEEARRPPFLLSPDLLRRLGVRPDAASIIRVEGDSMAPRLSDGDEILVDRDRRDVPPRGGIYVIRLDGALMVKRVLPAIGGFDVISDNPAHPPRFAGRAEMEVLGCVVWLGRALV